MAGGGSIAALSRLGSFGGANPNRNQFFDPTGQAADEQDAWGQADDALELQTGLNTTARSELALRQMQDMFDELDARQAQRRNAQHLMDASWLGPDGQARVSPDLAAGDRSLYLGDERVAHEAANLPTTLHMEHDKLLNQEQAKAEGYWIPQNVSAREDQRRNAEDVLSQKNTLATELQQTKDVGANLRAMTAAHAVGQRAQTDAEAKRAAAIDAMIGKALGRGDINPLDPGQADKLKALADLFGHTAPTGAAPMGQAGGPADGTTRTMNGHTYAYSSTGPKGPGFYLVK